MTKTNIKAMHAQQQMYDEQLRAIVKNSIEEERSIVESMSNPHSESLPLGQRIADRVAQFGGSWTFIILFCTLLFIWILFNVLALRQWRFDPFPFILMNLVLSCLAALQAPVIMMSQNRQEEKDRKVNENDYLINLKAELQIRKLHEKLDLLEAQQIKKLFELQAEQMEILKKLLKKIDGLEKK